MASTTFEIRSDAAYRQHLAAERQKLWASLKDDRRLHEPREYQRRTDRIKVITNTLNGHDSDTAGGTRWVGMMNNVGGLYDAKRHQRADFEVEHKIHEFFKDNVGRNWWYSLLSDRARKRVLS